MNSVSDLVASAKTVHARYLAGRMERETVREWVIRLGSYPQPHGDRVREAAEWFRAAQTDPVPLEVKLVDLDRLSAIVSG
ncbi:MULTISPECIES: hypothetical protein [unclassified Rhizobium]|uniref:hypothetical protein n=1 Tax=unclassified Rhizobium TaxID=2613769 RepID=UPI000382D718|nr:MULTISPECIES: hypothetical protein [unclassified Rhizobium]MBO9127483.1 hypothetical protein [Rhizobium sp. 16-488-2b]MBO9177926.1 hypothetical protein [Rhizobium sp. 16-488-2a]MBO9197720.1 hypothetical protein [Rhizobium sp. 16-449-1b]